MITPFSLRLAPMPYLPAILWVLLSTLIWTVIFAAAKLADGGIGVFQLTLLRYLGAMAVLLLLLPLKGGIRAHRSRQPGAHLIRAICGSGAAVAITWASARMPLVNATAIAMTNGVLALLLGVVFLGERIGRTHGIAVLVTLAGAAVILIGKGAFQSGVTPLPALLALTSAALLAAEALLISLLGRRERAYTVMLHVTGFGLCLTLIPALMTWQSIAPGTLIFCIALGPLGVLGQYCTLRGYRSAPLSVVAPVDYSWLVFSALFGVILFGEWPDPMTWIGGGAILAGGIGLARIGARN